MNHTAAPDSAGGGNASTGVFFVPFYFYLSYENFRRVIAALACQGIDARMLCMHFNAHDERTTYAPQRLERDGVPALDLELDLAGMQARGTLSKIVKLRCYFQNRCRIRRFLATYRPGLIVVESDLGGLYIRTLIQECRSMGIKVAVLVTLDVGQAIAPRFFGSAFRWFWNRILRPFGGIRALLFRSEIIGTFATGSPILAPSEAVRMRLVSGGVESERIQVTGSPQQDQVFELRQADRKQEKAAWLRRRGLPPETRLLVFCTEVIEEVLGQDYVRSMHATLARTLNALPPDCKVVLRFHPRELAENLIFYRELFQGDRYLEAPEDKLDALLHLADLCLGHFSSVLLKAIALGTPILSINLGRSTHLSLFGLDQPLPQILTEYEFMKTHAFFTDPATQEALQEFFRGWSAEHFLDLDGNRANHIAGILMEFREVRVG